MYNSKKIIGSDEIDEIKNAAVHLRAIDNPLRLEILDIIWENNNLMAVSQLCRRMNIVQSVVSGHLAILRKSQLVNIKREGKFIYYSVNLKRTDQIFHLFRQMNRF